MKRNIRKLVSKMSLKEKASLCSGDGFWFTQAIERLGIPGIMMADGPSGLRKQVEPKDQLCMLGSVPATCFPTESALSCSFDRDLIHRVAAAMGDECQAEGVSILLGPGSNIKRSPLCGRNFEYFSEDPFLSAELAASFIEGLQSRGVGACLKHFAANNQETLRMVIDAQMDERTLREIYLAAFEYAVKKAKPWTVMCAYNKLNGEYCSENKLLLKDILKKEWDFEGFVMSDWGAVNDRTAALHAGLDLEMPDSGGERDKRIADAVYKGQLKLSALNDAVHRLLRVILKAADAKKEGAQYDPEVHHSLARQAAEESAVLLKNEDGLLPLKKEGAVAVIGAMARKPRYQGGGSSHVNPTRLDKAYDSIKELAEYHNMRFAYADGYAADEKPRDLWVHKMVSASDTPDEAMIAEAVAAAKNADSAIVFAGLPVNYEFEGVDRKHLRLPEGQNALICAVAAAQKNTVVVLSNGAPVEMPWIDEVKAVLEMYLAGQAMGSAAARILFGDANPCGKLAETFPKKLADTPCYIHFPGGKRTVEYREGIYVGYRYYDTAGVQPLFAFGHGLSYTSFEYSGLQLDQRVMERGDALKISFRVKNTGKLAGKEIVQIYVHDVKSTVPRPQKELKGFEKICLAPGEEREISFTLDCTAFSYFCPEKRDWIVEAGFFDILIGASSADIRLSDTVRVLPPPGYRHAPFTANTLLKDILAESDRIRILQRLIREFLKKFPECSNVDDISPQIMEMPLRAAMLYTQFGYSERILNFVLKILNKD